jgi:thiol-disulfide isomerase/thioredoxin
MPMRLGSPMPSLEGATNSYNGGAVVSATLAGRPVLVHFWAVSCHICHEVMPELIRYRDQYRGQGLQVVGIHMPKQESDLDSAKVEKDMADFAITHPVLVDNAHSVTEAFQNQFVPAFFLFDAQGNLFFRAAGDKGLQNLGPKLEQLFGAAGA